jgi:hypothetical protein
MPNVDSNRETILIVIWILDPLNDYIFVFQSIMGLSYSVLASALWPMVALVVPEHQLGTAYGM